MRREGGWKGGCNQGYDIRHNHPIVRHIKIYIFRSLTTNPDIIFVVRTISIKSLSKIDTNQFNDNTVHRYPLIS